jgi:hypothetical protein
MMWCIQGLEKYSIHFVSRTFQMVTYMALAICAWYTVGRGRQKPTRIIRRTIGRSMKLGWNAYAPHGLQKGGQFMLYSNGFPTPK